MSPFLDSVNLYLFFVVLVQCGKGLLILIFLKNQIFVLFVLFCFFVFYHVVFFALIFIISFILLMLVIVY